MGRKVHPVGFRIGTIRDWQAKWYADKHYPEFLNEDLNIRQAIRYKYAEAGVSLVEIERQANKVSVSIYTARPGIVIGRGGQRVDEVRRYIENLIGKRVQLNIQEIRQPELDAYLVAKSVAEQIERRVAYRRAMKQAIFRTMQAGAQGVKISCSGRLGGVEIARRQVMHQGRVPLHTLRADVDFGFTEARTTLGRIGVKVWIYRGDILPEIEQEVAEEEMVEAASLVTEAETEATEAAAKPVKPRARRKVAAKKAEPVVAGAEEAPAKAEAEPAKVKAKRATKAKPPKAKEVEEKPAKPSAEPKKLAKPRAKRVTRAKPSAAKEAKAKPAEAIVEPEKAEKPRVRQKTKAETAAVKKAKAKASVTKKGKEKAEKPAKGTTAEAESAVAVDKEETDVTAETGKISQES
jgi:small subunit ribosomal protein S3